MLTIHARRLLSLTLLAALALGLLASVGSPVQAQDATGTPDLTASPSPAASQEVKTETWEPPVNLSQSGAASAPLIVAEANGSLHALWWDAFEGTQYAFFTPDKGWSQPGGVFSIVGARATSSTSNPTPPSKWRMFLDSTRELHVFWIEARGNLMYAQSRAGSNSWSAGLQLATAPLAWDAALGANGALHVAFVRSDNSDLLPSGIYYRGSGAGGRTWENVKLVTGSPYFRTVTPEAAHVGVTASTSGLVVVTWDDPQLQRSFFAESTTSGKSFGEPVRLEAADALRDDSARRERLVALASGKFLRLWQAGDSCVLYQQESDETGQNWSAPLRVLETLGGCPTGWQAYQLTGDQVVLNITAAQAPGGAALAVWDGARWSEPISPRVSFVNPATNRSTALGCLDVAVTNERLAIIGCDNSQDVWVTTSTIPVAELLPALDTAWQPPSVISSSDGDADLPAVAVEADGRMHVLWNASTTDVASAQGLQYSRGDGALWSEPVPVLNSPLGGKAESPSLLADASGILHATWSGGFAGEVFYSQSFVRDADSSRGWSQPATLPAPTTAGGWPSLAADSAATLHVIYAIPLNENRGVYYTRSTDGGATWSEPQRLFDAAAAGWAMVTETRLVIDGRNRLHATWVQAALPPATTGLGVYYSRSEDGGQSWSEPAQVSQIDSAYPIIASARPDEIHLMWTANLSSEPQLWHQWSSDGGATWSQASPLLGVRNISPRADMISDGAGQLYLVGVARILQDSASLFFLSWTPQGWSEREDLPLGYTADSAAGAKAVLLPDGRLGVFYRLRAPTGTGQSHYVLGYTERPVEVNLAPPAPTVAPQPSATPVPAEVTAVPDTPMPTADLNTGTTSPITQTDWVRIGSILAGMLVVVVVAIFGLRAARR
ncbi:MAG: sialidase family protein [Anaerolineales bacterium]